MKDFNLDHAALKLGVILNDYKNTENKAYGYLCLNPKNRLTKKQKEYIELFNSSKLDGVYIDYVTMNDSKDQFNDLMRVIKEGDVFISVDMASCSRSIGEYINVFDSIVLLGAEFTLIQCREFDTITHNSFTKNIINELRSFNNQVKNRSMHTDSTKTRGVDYKPGRKLDKSADLEKAINMYLEGTYTTKEIVAATNVNQVTLYRHLNKRGIVRSN